MKTEDGHEIQQGKKYWHVRVKADKTAKVKGMSVMEPTKLFAWRSYPSTVLVFKDVAAAWKWVEENKPETLADFIEPRIDYRKKLTDIINTLSMDSCEDLCVVLEELEKAQKKFPVWPDDIFERLAKVSEEAGELAQSVNNLNEKNGTYQSVKTEAAQTAAMGIRFLNNLIECKTVD